MNRNVTLTIVITKNDQVTANFALVQPSVQADGPKILKEIVDLLGGGEVPDIASLARRNMGDRRMQDDPKLRRLLSTIYDQETSPEKVQETITAVEKHVADKPAARRLVGQAAGRLLRSGDFEKRDEQLRRTVRRWARKYGRRPANRDATRRAGAADQDPNLRPLLQPLIQKEATPEEVDKAAEAIEKYIATHEKAKQQVGRITSNIVQAGLIANYGTPRCQEYIQAWAQKYGSVEPDTDHNDDQRD